VLHKIRAFKERTIIGRWLRPGRQARLQPQPRIAFRASPQYWEDRYKKGGNSGAGSHGRLALFKADVINRFVSEHRINSVAELGCGDGAQLALGCYRKYVGLDVSQRALDICRARYKGDRTKQFFHVSSLEASAVKADLALSLDVVYHLIEDTTYDSYMRQLTAAAERYLCVYSSNFDGEGPAPHIKHRRFTNWMEHCAPSFSLISRVCNPHPYDPARPDETSWADFYFFSRGD
jgi:SAM-dependent methyltransferase